MKYLADYKCWIEHKLKARHSSYKDCLHKCGNMLNPYKYMEIWYLYCYYLLIDLTQFMAIDEIFHSTKRDLYCLTLCTDGLWKQGLLNSSDLKCRQLKKKEIMKKKTETFFNAFKRPTIALCEKFTLKKDSTTTIILVRCQTWFTTVTNKFRV